MEVMRPNQREWSLLKECTKEQPVTARESQDTRKKEQMTKVEVRDRNRDRCRGKECDCVHCSHCSQPRSCSPPSLTETERPLVTRLPYPPVSIRAPYFRLCGGRIEDHLPLIARYTAGSDGCDDGRLLVNILNRHGIECTTSMQDRQCIISSHIAAGCL